MRIGNEVDGLFPVRAEFQGAAWSDQIPARLELLETREIALATTWLERSFVEAAYLRDFGTRLFRTLFPPTIAAGWQMAHARVAGQTGVRLALELPQSLSTLPWELMWDPQFDRPLARALATPMVRLVPGASFPTRLPTTFPLRVLLVTASPSDLPPVSTEAEIAAIKRHVAGRDMAIRDVWRMTRRHLAAGRNWRELADRLRRRSLVEVTVLTHPTRARLQQHLLEARSRQETYHVVHFAGHGQTDEKGGYLVLEDEAGKADIISAEGFLELATDGTLALLVLSACHSSGSLPLFQNLAQGAVQQQIPNMIGMQTIVLDQAAVTFAQEFYGAWVAGEPLDASLVYARRLLAQEAAGAAADWGVPVLYARTPESLSLAVESPPLLWPRSLGRLYRLAVAVLVCLSLLITFATAYGIVRQALPSGPFAMNPNEFNVVVADMGEIGHPGPPPDEPARSSTTGTEIGEFLTEQIRDVLEADTDASFIAEPQRVKALTGDVDARMQALAMLFDQTRADVVIYGNLVPAGANAQVVALEVALSPRLYVGADELTEPQAVFNVRIPVEPFSGAWENVKPKTTALASFLRGLRFFRAAQYPEASDKFALALSISAWSDQQTADLLHLWYGTSLLRRLELGDQASEFTCALPDKATADMLSCARDAYTHARGDTEREFPRADIGLGHLSVLEAANSELPRVARCDLYRLALTDYDRARDAAEDEHSYIALNAVFSGARAAALAFRQQCDPLEEWYKKAVCRLRSATVQFANLAPGEVLLDPDIGARIYYELGRVQLQNARPDEAKETLIQAIQVADTYSQTASTDAGWRTIRWPAKTLLGAAYALEAQAGRAEMWPQAIDELRPVVAEYSATVQAYGPDPGVWDGKIGDIRDWLITVGIAHHWLGLALNRTGAYTDAIGILDAGVELVENRLDADVLESLRELPWQLQLELACAHSALATTADGSNWTAAVAAYNQPIAALAGGNRDAASYALHARYYLGRGLAALHETHLALPHLEEVVGARRLAPELGDLAQKTLDTIANGGTVPLSALADCSK
jgi:hypothetical protein